MVAKATGTVGAHGRLQVRLRFTKAAKRSLRRLRTAKLTVSGAGATATVTLKR